MIWVKIRPRSFARGWDELSEYLCPGSFHLPRSSREGPTFLEMNIVIFKIRTILCMCLAFTFFSLAFAPAFVAAAEKTVVFVAGRDSHGFGSHEHGGVILPPLSRRGCRVSRPGSMPVAGRRIRRSLMEPTRSFSTWMEAGDIPSTGISKRSTSS